MTSKLPCIVLVTCCAFFVVMGQQQQPGGSKCPGVSCVSGPPGLRCEPRYKPPRDNGCCPVWYCTDSRGGTSTHYGMSSTSGGSTVQTMSTSSGGYNNPNFFTGFQSFFQNMFGGRR